MSALSPMIVRRDGENFEAQRGEHVIRDRMDRLGVWTSLYRELRERRKGEFAWAYEQPVEALEAFARAEGATG